MDLRLDMISEPCSERVSTFSSFARYGGGCDFKL